jgi:FlaA1/EpsC-like NDP-sugar epimerase
MIPRISSDAADGTSAEETSSGAFPHVNSPAGDPAPSRRPRAKTEARGARHSFFRLRPFLLFLRPHNMRRTAKLVGQQALAFRAWLLGLGHAAIFVVVYWLAFALRFDFDIPPAEWTLLLMTLPWVVATKSAVFLVAGHYRGWWRYVTFADLVALVRASVLSLFGILALLYFVLRVHVPCTVLALDFAFSIGILGVLRSSFRVFREHFLPAITLNDSRWALMVGIDDASAVLAHQIQSQATLPYRLRGLLTTDGRAKFSQLGQMPILGHVDQVAEIAIQYRATDVLVTAGILPGGQFRRLMDACNRAKLNLKIIPPISERINGSRRIPVRDIEINDLLRREPVELDTGAINHLLEGRTVMVTGAGGSIGSEICRQVLRFHPKKLILVGRGENRIFHIERELGVHFVKGHGRRDPRKHERSTSQRHGSEGDASVSGVGASDESPSPIVVTKIADVTDAPRMRRLFAKLRPEVVFHAAAHKHVPLMEANPGEAIKNNVLGTKIVADLAHEFNANCFVFISTDKAVRPTSVMGASKQLAERYVMALSQQSNTRFVATRFGNVLGSAGSVVPLFQEQIRQGGPITVTDPRMTRFFMTIPEASQLVLQAAAMGKGGEIFVLDMGEPVRIVDLARDMIRLSGLPENSIEITYRGIRPGEKLYEELYFDDEETLPTPHKKLRIAYHRPFTLAEVVETIDDLAELQNSPEESIRNRLHELLSERQASSSDGRDRVTHRHVVVAEASGPHRDETSH